MFEKKRGTRFLASVMALVMLLSLAPVGALAADGETLTNEESPAVTQPANEAAPKPVVTDEQNTENTNEETTPPPSNEDDTGIPADNNDTSTAVSEMPVIMNPVDLLNQASEYTTELTWSQPSSTIEKANFFYLKTPTSNPDSNTNLDWGDCLGEGKIDTSNLDWRDTGINTRFGRVKNAYSVENNISEWPSAKVTKDEINNCYEIKKKTDDWNDVFEAYKSSIMSELNVTDITEDDISSIILKPYKFSMNNEPDGYHVDCKIEVKCKKTVTATFYVQDASKNQDRYHQVEAKNYKTNDIVQFPEYTGIDGYDFSGWYLDEELKNAVPNGEYTITDNVNFYAKYTPKTYTVTWRNWDETVLTTDANVEHGTTVVAPTNPTKTDDDQYTYTFKHWSTTKNGEAATDLTQPVTADRTYYAVYEATKKENPPTPITNLAYKIIQHFRDGKGNPSTANPDITDNKTTTNAQATLDSLITGDLKQSKTGTDSKTYVYVPGETKFTLNDKAVTALVDGTEIHLYYYLDEVGGASEKEGADTPDNIPDAWQYKVTFKVVNGSWNDKTNEAIVKYVTKKDAAGNNSATGTAKLDTVPEVGKEPNGGYKTSGNWNTTPSTGLEITKDTVFTYTYDQKSGGSGGSGGSSRPSTPPTVDIPDDVPTGLNGKDHYAYIIGYGNNDVRPQNNITRAEVATIFFRLLTDETREANMTKSNGYNDVKDGDWFCCAVSTLSKMGIIKGYEDGSFKPNDPISRAEFAAIAARFDPDGDKTPATFADVTSHWAKDEISIAANHGWIKGYEDGSFKPDQKITRAETMTLVNRVLNRLPETKDDLHKDMKTWVDNMDETAWYYLAVQEATNSHYFKNKTGTKFEQWTELRDTRDWSELEK